MKITVLCPHFAPDTAPTGQVITQLVKELSQKGHRIHVVTSLPWYRTHSVEEDWKNGYFLKRKRTGAELPEFTLALREAEPT